MTQDTPAHTPRDRSRVSLEDPTERQYWCQRFGVTAEQLDEAVRQVGTELDAVTSYLQTPATGRTS
ncbi:DUF3606 domain-containing protein [Bordetella sp. 2513F-2]